MEHLTESTPVQISQHENTQEIHKYQIIKDRFYSFNWDSICIFKSGHGSNFGLQPVLYVNGAVNVHVT